MCFVSEVEESSDQSQKAALLIYLLVHSSYLLHLLVLGYQGMDGAGVGSYFKWERGGIRPWHSCSHIIDFHLHLRHDSLKNWRTHHMPNYKPKVTVLRGHWLKDFGKWIKCKLCGVWIWEIFKKTEPLLNPSVSKGLTCILREGSEQRGSNLRLRLIRLLFFLLCLSFLIGVVSWFHCQVNPSATALKPQSIISH